MSHATQVPQDEPSFPAWAFLNVQRIRKAVGLGALFAAALSIKNLDPHTWFGLPDDALKTLLDNHLADRKILAFIQAAACIALALLTPRPSTERLAQRRRSKATGDEFTTAVKACRRIQLFVVAAFLSWAVYYVFTGMSMQHSDPFTRAFAISLNTIPSVLLFWLYLELAELTVEPKTGTSRATSTAGAATRKHTGLGDAAFHRVISVGVLFIIVVPAWYAQGIGNARGLLLLDILASCLNGVSLALVIGRLGSKFIDPGSFTLGLLYFYAVIQPTAPMFPEWPLVQLIATTVALPLKVLLWLVCVWAFTTGIMAEYVHEIRIFLTAEAEAQPAE